MEEDENLVADQIHIVPCQLLTWIETLKQMGPFQMYPFLFQFVVPYDDDELVMVAED